MKMAKKVTSLILLLTMLLPTVLTAIPVHAVESATEIVAGEETQPSVTRTMCWDFTNAADLEHFSLYQSAGSQFTVIDGMLAPSGTDGEMKAIVSNSPENIKSVSVDVIPGPSGVITGGLYFGASDAQAARDVINSQVFLIESNHTDWPDAPNRVDVVRGEFTTENQWQFFDMFVSETGFGNNLFSGGRKKPLRLQLVFCEDTVLLNLSLVSDPTRYVQLMYDMDPADMIGQIGLRASYSDTRFDNLRIEYEQPLTEYQKLWDFSDAAQAEDFTFYQSDKCGFAVSDGMLKTNGNVGEMKALLNENMTNISAMSVDIIPGASGLLNGGVYVGAKNAADGMDQIDALEVFVESMFTEWADAPNRVDIWLGEFNQKWVGQVEGSRFVSETQFNNNLFFEGVKKPLTLLLEFNGTVMTATLSLKDNVNRFIQTTYNVDAKYLEGLLGLRNFQIDMCYDNLIITYKEPVERPAPEPETVYENEGSSFSDINLRTWKLTEDLAETPYTVEAWVKIPEGVSDSVSSYILTNRNRAPYISLEMIPGGKLRLAVGAENEKLVIVGNVYDVDTDLRTGKWTHIAYTMDAASDRVVAYINGEVVATWDNAALPEIDFPDNIYPNNLMTIGSYSYWNLGKDLVVYKPWAGWIADVRMWNKPLSAEEIKDSMLTQYTEPRESLLVNLPLNEKVNDAYLDLSGNGNNATIYSASLTLEEQTHEPGSYSMVVIPDQQILNNHYPSKLYNMYQWIVDNREKENIQAVMNVGDMADISGRRDQWERVRAAVDMLPDDLPFITVPGNHDYDTNSGWDQGYGVREQLTLMNEFLPRSLFENYPTEIGFFDEVNSANQWQAFTVNGHPYLIIALEYIPQDDVIAWANEVVEAHPDHQVIMITHSFVGNYGELHVPKLWSDFLSKHENVIMSFSGHVQSGSAVCRTDLGVNGNTVYNTLMDAQFADGIEGGLGMIGILRFNADGTLCNLSYYSTDRDMYNDASNLTLELPVRDKPYVAMTGGKRYTSVAEALSKSNGKLVRVLASSSEKIMVSADAVIDLAGYTLSDVTVAENATLTLIDTATDDYKDAYGTATVTGAVNTFAEVDGKDYMVVNENGEYSAHRYDVAITHISLKPANDALGYKAQVYGDEVVQSHVKSLGFNMWVDGGKTKTFEKAASSVTLRLQNILACNGGEININATAFITLEVGEQTTTKTGSQQTTTMKETLKKVNDAWADYSEAQQTAVKNLCDQHYEDVKYWNLNNIYFINAYGDVSVSYTPVTGSFTTITDSGVVVDEGKLHVNKNGEAKIILAEEIKGNKTVSVDLYPGADNRINAGIYLGAANAHAPQDSIYGIVVGLESFFEVMPNRMDIMIGNFPVWQEHYRMVMEGDKALFTDNQAEPVNLTVKIEGNVLTVTVFLLSDPSKSATATYTYTGSYDLTVGHVGLRSQFNDVIFDNFKVTADGKQINYSFDNGNTDGLQFYHSAYCNGAKITANNTLALHNGATFTDGTLAASINTAGIYQAGIVFGADETASSYYLFRLCDNQFIELVKVVDGVATVLDSGYLSAGHNYNRYNRLEVIKNGNIISCYFYNGFGKVNCYAYCEDDAPLSGDRFGFYAANSGTMVGDVTITDNVTLPTAEVLIFGHSYTEMWHQYQTYFPEYPDIDNIGIGGSVAAHWEALADEVITYQPKLGIYNIGINDLSGNTSPKAIVESMESALLQIKKALPEFEVVLVSVSHCPARAHITDTISQTNALMRNLADSYDWMYYAEAEYLFCSDSTDPLSTIDSLFIDGLHPSAEGYQLMADVIKSAVRGEN